MTFVSSIIKLERTLAIIKPHVVPNFPEIEKKILLSGFTILDIRRVQLTVDEAKEFFKQERYKNYFEPMIADITSGPILAIVLAKQDAVSAWLKLIGPSVIEDAKIKSQCLRAKFAIDFIKNGFHGSETLSDAEKELRFFFPDTILEPIPTGLGAKDYLSRTVYPLLLKGLTELCKRKPADPVIWLSDWLLQNNPNGSKVDPSYIYQN